MKKKPKLNNTKPRTMVERDANFYRNPTQREIEVIRLVAEGYKNKEIAGEMGISVKTVETHRSNVMNKLAFRTVADLMRYAIQKGIIKIELE
ncbi:MAG: response regulator transcription factor [Nitrospirae bacterium]|nr:response regulator transcription factor [Nitrospirota bacterium]MBI3803509.1 response regulator transcription factor [Candidatus Manganitrophaceae bacterium]